LKQSNPGQFKETPGGAALNVSSSLKALGADVKLSSILGEDRAGYAITDAMNARGVELAAQSSPDGATTACYTAIIDPTGDLIIALADMDIYDKLLAQTVEIERTDWLTVDANLSLSTIEAVTTRTAAHKAALTVSAAKAARLRPVLDRLDVLFTNRAEAAVLCALAPDTPMPNLANALAALGTRRAVISDGASSICVLDQRETAFVDVPPTDGLDVTGAGDALAAGCLFALGQNASMLKAVNLGVRTAQAILTVSGPYRADLAGFTRGSE
jgi:pseudouridine kinase